MPPTVEGATCAGNMKPSGRGSRPVGVPRESKIRSSRQSIRRARRWLLRIEGAVALDLFDWKDPLRSAMTLLLVKARSTASTWLSESDHEGQASKNADDPRDPPRLLAKDSRSIPA